MPARRQSIGPILALAIAAWLAVALGLNSDVVAGLGWTGRLLLVASLVPNLVLWTMLRRRPGGAMWASALATSFVLMTLWNGGVARRFHALSSERTATDRAAAERARHASPTYRQKLAADRARCATDPKLCWELGTAYRADGAADEDTLDFFATCCQGAEHVSDERCCAAARGLVDHPR